MPKFAVYLVRRPRGFAVRRAADPGGAQVPLGEKRFIRVPNGKKVLLGRGPFLGLTDETISRAQAELCGRATVARRPRRR